MDCSSPGSFVHGILQTRGCGHTILQQDLPTQGSKPHHLWHLHCRRIRYPLNNRRSPNLRRDILSFLPYSTSCRLIPENVAEVSYTIKNIRRQGSLRATLESVYQSVYYYYDYKIAYEAMLNSSRVSWLYTWPLYNVGLGDLTSEHLKIYIWFIVICEVPPYMRFLPTVVLHPWTQPTDGIVL